MHLSNKLTFAQVLKCWTLPLLNLWQRKNAAGVFFYMICKKNKKKKETL